MSAYMDDLERPIRTVLDRFFADGHVTATITYRHYQGQNELGEDSFNDYPLPVIPFGKRVRNTCAGHRVPVQTGFRSFIVRDVDLPSAVAIDDLSTNDRIIVAEGPEELLVVEIDKTLGFVVEVQARGA